MYRMEDTERIRFKLREDRRREVRERAEKEEEVEIQLEVAHSETSPSASRRTTFTAHCEKNCLKCVKL